MSAKACRWLPAAFLIVLALAPPAGAGVLSGPATPAGEVESGLFAWLLDLLGELGFSSDSGPGIDPNGPPAS